MIRSQPHATGTKHKHKEPQSERKEAHADHWTQNNVCLQGAIQHLQPQSPDNTITVIAKKNFWKTDLWSNYSTQDRLRLRHFVRSCVWLCCKINGLRRMKSTNLNHMTHLSDPFPVTGHHGVVQQVSVHCIPFLLTILYPDLQTFRLPICWETRW